MRWLFYSLYQGRQISWLVRQTYSQVSADSSDEWTETTETPSVTDDDEDPLLTNTDLARILVTVARFERDPLTGAGPVMMVPHRAVNEGRRVNFANSLRDP